MKWYRILRETFIFLREFPNTGGHGVVAGHTTGKIFSGYYTEDLVELTDYVQAVHKPLSSILSTLNHLIKSKL